MGRNEVVAIERALQGYRSAAAKLELYRTEKQIDSVLISDNEMNETEQHLQTLLKEIEDYTKNPDLPRRVSIAITNLNELVCNGHRE